MIKKILKGLGRLAALSVILTSLYLVNLFSTKPYSIDHYLGKELVFGLMDSPEAMTYIGVFDRFNWLTKHNSKLSIPQEDDIEKDIVDLEKSIKTLYKYDDSKLSDNQRITKKIAIFDLENSLKELKEFPYLDYPLNQIGGIHLNTVEFMSGMHPIRNKSSAAASAAAPGFAIVFTVVSRDAAAEVAAEAAAEEAAAAAPAPASSGSISFYVRFQNYISFLRSL